MTQTTVVSNGSRWADEAPTTVDALLAVLATEPLDPSFERYGNFVLTFNTKGAAHFWGNFANRSHVFDIHTTDRALAATLRRAIRQNQQTPAYLALRSR